MPVAAGEKVARHFAPHVDRRHDCLRHVNVAPGRVVSVRFSLCFDDVGIGTCIAVKGADSVVIERVRGQTRDVLTVSADSPIVVSQYVSAKSIAQGYV